MAKSSKVQEVLSNKGDAIDERADFEPGAEAPDEATAATTTREDRIRLAAYAAAERRGFEPGFETEDWLAAEREVDGEDDGRARPHGSV